MFNRREIRIRAMQYLYTHFLHEKISTTPTAIHKKTPHHQLQHEVEQVQKGCLAILQLLIAWRDITQKEEKKRHDVLLPLLTSPILQTICQSPLYANLSKKYGLLWEQDTLLLLYYDQIQKIQSIMATVGETTDQSRRDLTSLRQLVKKVIFHEEGLANELAALNISWEVNSHLIKQTIYLFIKKVEQEPMTAFALLTQTPTADETAFYTNLIIKVQQEHLDYTEKIKAQSKHWSVDRISFLDHIILKMALAEFFHFPAIAPNVTVNEYLEIAKHYSTPRSSIFIHGVLDSIIQQQTKKT